MIRRVTPALAAAFLVLTAVAGHAALLPYTQNFETLVQTDPAALANDGWVVYGNVFSPDHSTYLYGYGPFPAPNPGGGFCAIDVGQGGAQQGAQQLSVYSDYNNGDHANGNLIESNVYHEQAIVAGDVGVRWTFQFDAKLGNLAFPSTALAFVKTLDPAHGYATTNFRWVDMTAIPATWNTYTISLVIAPGLVGQLAQFGFANTATRYESSGIYYDNVSWTAAPPGVGVTADPRAPALALSAPVPSPSSGATRITFSLAERGASEIGVFDLAGRHVATLFRGTAEPGTHVAGWDGRIEGGGLAPAGVYRCVLSTAAGSRSRSLVLVR